MNNKYISKRRSLLSVPRFRANKCFFYPLWFELFPRFNNFKFFLSKKTQTIFWYFCLRSLSVFIFILVKNMDKYSFFFLRNEEVCCSNFIISFLNPYINIMHQLHKNKGLKYFFCFLFNKFFKKKNLHNNFIFNK